MNFRLLIGVAKRPDRSFNRSRLENHDFLGVDCKFKAISWV